MQNTISRTRFIARKVTPPSRMASNEGTLRQVCASKFYEHKHRNIKSLNPVSQGLEHLSIYLTFKYI